MKVKEQLIKLIEEKDWRTLPEIIKSHNKTRGKEETALEEALRELSQSQQANLWESILNVFIEKYIGKYFEKEVDVSTCTEITNEEVEEDQLIVESFLALGFITTCLINEEKDATTPTEKLVQFVVLIGGLVSEFNDPIHEVALNLCEKWIKNKFERSEEIVADTLLAILEICLQPKPKKNDVKRAWSLRSGLPILCNKATNEEYKLNAEIKKLLLSCVSSSSFLNCEEGIKFLSLIFSAPNLILICHEEVKSAMPYITISQSEKYSQIYFRSWKNSQGELKEILEEKCLQDLMYLAIHADPLVSRLSNNLNCFLHHIHKHKKHLQTASMIYSLYEPFIWRSLKVANGYVRRNATTLLCDLFPCTDISLTREEKEELMDQQYQAFLALLVDPCHLVRIVAVKGIFSILSDFWLLIPSNIIQKFFQIFLKRLIVDASSGEIRMLVVQGMARLLDCPDAGPYMSDVLPHIASSFDDINTSVRIAFVKLLLKVKTTRFVKYWKLVPMEHLLNRLAEDGSSVRALITQLIYSSFFSAHLKEPEMVQRCITLIEMNREGARRFYQYSSKKLDMETTTRFILFIWRTLQRYSQMANMSQSSCNSSNSTIDTSESQNALINSPKRKTKKQRKSRSENKENKAPEPGLIDDDSNKLLNSSKDENEDSNDMPLDNPAIVGGLLDTIAILWTMNSMRLSQPQNLKYLDALRTRISRGFPVIWSFFKENEEISNTLLYMSSFLPKSHVPTMIGLCLSRLKSIEENEKIGGNFGTYVNALCNWNRLDDIIELVSEWIDDTFSSVRETGTSKTDQETRRARVCFKEKAEPKPLLALRIVDHILKHPLNKVNLLQTNRNLLINLCQKMNSVQKYLEERCKNTEGELSPLCTDQFLLDCWSDYLCIVALLNHVSPPEEENESRGRQEDENRRAPRSTMTRRSHGTSSSQEVADFDSLSTFKEHMLWMNKILDENSDLIFNQPFYHSCAANFVKGSSDLIAIGIADENFLSQYLMFVQNLLREAPFDLNTWCWSLRGISHAHNHLRVYSSKKDYLIPEESITCQTFEASILILKEKEQMRELDQERMSSLSEMIESTLLCVSQNADQTLNLFSEVLAKFILEDIFRQVSENPRTSEFTRLKDLNGVSFIFLTSVHKKTRLAQTFISTLKNIVGKSVQEYKMVMSAVLLLSILSNDCGKMSRHNLKETTRAIDEIMQRTEFSSYLEENSGSMKTDLKMFFTEMKKIHCHLLLN